MADIPQEGDELKKAYLEKALNANSDATSGAKFSDLFDKGSTIYEKPELTEEQKIRSEEVKKQNTPPPKPTVDADGYPIMDNVHTYKEDLAGIINKDKISLERIAMMQSTASQNIPAPEEPVKNKNRVFMIAGGVLILLGIIVVFGVFAFRKNAAAPSSQAVQKEKYIIFAESSKNTNITNSTKTEIKAAIQGFANLFRDQDSVEEIVPALDSSTGLRRATLTNVLDKTNASVPDDMARTLYDRFFLGLYSKAGKTDPFMILYTSSYDIAYPAMLRWEGIMQTDLNWLFDTQPKIGTTTPLLTFKDRVIANTDARSYEDASGKVAFYYVFLDQNTILLARSSDTVRMVQDRLRQAKFQ